MGLITGMIFPCPRCHRDRAEVEPGLWRGFGEAVKAADLTAAELAQFGDYLRSIGQDVDPERAAADQPRLAGLIQFAAGVSRAEWLAILFMILGLVGTYLQPVIEPPAAPASKTVIVDRSSQIDNRDLMKLAKRLAANIEHQQHPQDGRHSQDDKADRSPGLDGDRAADGDH